MKSDYFENLYEKSDYLKKWLQRHKEARQTAFEVQKVLDITKWEIDALANSPSALDIGTQNRLNKIFNIEIENIKNVLPMIPSYDISEISSMGTFASSGSSDVYTHVTRIGETASDWAIAYSENHSKSYLELLLKQKRPEEIRNLISKLKNPKTLNAFNRALEAYSSVNIGTGNRTSTSIELRTLIDALQGDLFRIARKWDKENMTWEIMAERLAKGGKNSQEYQELLDQKVKRSALINDLSTIAKDREGNNKKSINVLWTQTLDVIFIILRLIKIN